MLEIERRSNRSHTVENSLWKTLWVCRSERHSDDDEEEEEEEGEEEDEHYWLNDGCYKPHLNCEFKD
jgi:hypothetical protein